MTPKEYILRMLESSRGDDLERAEMAFRGQGMDMEYGKSGRTRREILEAYKKDRVEWLAAKEWVSKL